MEISQNGAHGEHAQPRVVLTEHVSDHVIVQILNQCLVVQIVKSLVISNRSDHALINRIVQVS